MGPHFVLYSGFPELPFALSYGPLEWGELVSFIEKTGETTSQDRWANGWFGVSGTRAHRRQNFCRNTPYGREIDVNKENEHYMLSTLEGNKLMLYIYFTYAVTNFSPLDTVKQ